MPRRFDSARIQRQPVVVAINKSQAIDWVAALTELALIVIPVSFDIADLEFERSAFPEGEWIEALFIFELGIDRIHQFGEDLRTVGEEEYPSFILRMLGVG